MPVHMPEASGRDPSDLAWLLSEAADKCPSIQHHDQNGLVDVEESAVWSPLCLALEDTSRQLMADRPHVQRHLAIGDGESTAEVFPIVLSALLMSAAFAFSFVVAIIEYRKKRALKQRLLMYQLQQQQDAANAEGNSSTPQQQQQRPASSNSWVGAIAISVRSMSSRFMGGASQQQQLATPGVQNSLRVSSDPSSSVALQTIVPTSTYTPHDSWTGDEQLHSSWVGTSEDLGTPPLKKTPETVHKKPVGTMGMASPRPPPMPELLEDQKEEEDEAAENGDNTNDRAAPGSGTRTERDGVVERNKTTNPAGMGKKEEILFSEGGNEASMELTDIGLTETQKASPASPPTPVLTPAHSIAPTGPASSSSVALLSWHDLKCTYPSKDGTTTVTTLEDASGVLYSQEMAAIMGPSGGGKSTLLDILSGRKSLGNIEGSISVLGQVTTPAEAGVILKQVAAYVPQQEQFFPTQTPEEAVAFFANLQLGRDPRGDHVRMERIRSILDIVGLSIETRTRAIGGALPGGIVIRGLSGGERKRLALACAVAMKPKILFLDEITSGLDSENAVIVIKLLKKMCRSLKVAAAVVIHQPSGVVFESFDRLILLSKGRPIFANGTRALPAWYEYSLQIDTPPSYLMPDDLLKQASNWDSTKAKSMESSLIPTVHPDPNKDATKVDVTFWWAFQCVFYRNLENHYLRNLTNLVARLVIYASTGLILGLIFFQVGDAPLDNQRAQYIQGAGLFLSQGSFLLPFAQISTFFFDKKVFAAENALGLYPAFAYAISQFLLEAWLVIMAGFLQAVTAIPTMAVWNPVWDYSEYFFTMVGFFALNGLVGNGLVLFISMIAFSQDFAFLSGSGYITIALASSGGFVPLTIIPVWIRWLQWISPVKYSLQIFVQASFDGNDGVTLVEDLELNRPGTITANTLVMLAFFAVYAAVTIWILSRQKEQR